PELIACTVQFELVGTTDKLVVDDLSLEIVAEIRTVMPLSNDRCRFAKKIFFAELEASDIRCCARPTAAEYQRDFIDGYDREIDSAGIIRINRDRSIGEVRLRTKD